MRKTHFEVIFGVTFDKNWGTEKLFDQHKTGDTHPLVVAAGASAAAADLGGKGVYS